MTTEERKVHSILQALFPNVPLESAYATKGFWGKACARLITKNQALEATLEAAQEDAAEAKKIIDQYENFDLKFGEAAGKAMVEIRDLQGKLALAEAAQQKLAAVLEEAADLHMRYLAAVPGRFSDHHNDLPRERAFQAKMRSALARTEKEPTGDESLGEKENPRPHQRCRIHVHSRTNRLADPDGRSVKALIDGLVEAGILPGDDAECVSEVSQSQEKVKGEEQTIVDIIWET